MKAGKHNPCQISDKGKRTDEFVSEKLGIGSRDTYRKEKYIVDNQDSLTPKDFSEWDEGILSTNKAFNKMKKKKLKILLNLIYDNGFLEIRILLNLVDALIF